MADTVTPVAAPPGNLLTFHLDDLAQFVKEQAFSPDDSPDFRVFYAGRDDVHGILRHLLARCNRSLRMNMFGYDDAELDQIIRGLVDDEHVLVQGTLDKSQSGGVHEHQLLAGWDTAMRSSFAIGQSETHMISHTKGGVIDGLVAWEGSTNWSATGEGYAPAPGKTIKAQNNTLTIYTHPVQIQRFTDELDLEHAVALRQQLSSTK